MKTKRLANRWNGLLNFWNGISLKSMQFANVDLECREDVVFVMSSHNIQPQAQEADAVLTNTRPMRVPY